jgi:hypothetical protein
MIVMKDVMRIKIFIMILIIIKNLAKILSLLSKGIEIYPKEI